jgi:hypothetical protein
MDAKYSLGEINSIFTLIHLVNKSIDILNWRLNISNGREFIK